jgi:hypothetical protein
MPGSGQRHGLAWQTVRAEGFSRFDGDRRDGPRSDSAYRPFENQVQLDAARTVAPARGAWGAAGSKVAKVLWFFLSRKNFFLKRKPRKRFFLKKEAKTFCK